MLVLPKSFAIAIYFIDSSIVYLFDVPVTNTKLLNKLILQLKFNQNLKKSSNLYTIYQTILKNFALYSHSYNYKYFNNLCHLQECYHTIFKAICPIYI